MLNIISHKMAINSLMWVEMVYVFNFNNKNRFNMKTRRQFDEMKIDYYNMDYSDFREKYGELSKIEEEYLFIGNYVWQAIDFFDRYNIK